MPGSPNFKYKTIHTSDIIHENVSDDFHRKYYNGFFRLPSHGNRLFHWTGVDTDQYYNEEGLESGIEVVGHFIDGNDKFKKQRLNTNDMIFDFTFPELGYVNVYDNSYYVSINPNTQYNRCYNLDIINWDVPIDMYMLKEKRDRYTKDKSYNIAYNIFNKEYKSLEEAAGLIREAEKLSEIISKEFALGIVHKLRGIFLYYKTLPIGKLREDNIIEMLPGAGMFEDTVLREPQLKLYK